MKKGTFVRNPKKVAAGIGVVVTDRDDGRCDVFFEHEGAVKTIDQKYVTLEVIDDPGASRDALLNALIVPKPGLRPFRPWPDVLERFLVEFAGGFRGEKFERYERAYKLAAHEWCVEHLSQARFESMLGQQQHESLATDVRRLYQKTNLLASFELMKVADILNDRDAAPAVVEQLYHLLYGSDVPEQFDDWVRVLHRNGIDKWPVVTYPLFMRYPQKYMFVKPAMTREAADNYRYDIMYSSKPSWTTYQRIQAFATSLADRLRAEHKIEVDSRDMIDVQSFMWCTYTKGWTAAMHADVDPSLGGDLAHRQEEDC